jgi:hypothetical protein
MSPLRKGPELKMPDLKVPDFVLDVYYDLRERHLLPLVAILLVAIVALPIVLSQGSSDEEPVAATGIAGDGTTVPSSKLVVAKEAPGLRYYKRRLAGDTPKDPFKQQYTTPEGESSGTTGGEAEFTSPSGESGGSGTTGESGGSGTTGGGGGSAPETSHSSEGSGEPSNEEHLRYYSFAIDVRIAPVSHGDGAGQSKSKSKSKPKATVRRNLPELTALPSHDEPALTFIAVTKDRKKAVMLVSDDVTGLFGDSICLVGAEACQLLAIEPGMPETVVYGGRTYRIELLKLRLLKTDRLNVAPLGESGKSENGGG